MYNYIWYKEEDIGILVQENEDTVEIAMYKNNCAWQDDVDKKYISKYYGKDEDIQGPIKRMRDYLCSHDGSIEGFVDEEILLYHSFSEGVFK